MNGPYTRGTVHRRIRVHILANPDLDTKALLHLLAQLTDDFDQPQPKPDDRQGQVEDRAA